MADSQVVVRPGERIDQVSKRAQGDAFKHQALLDANPDLNLFYPMPGQVLTVKRD